MKLIEDVEQFIESQLNSVRMLFDLVRLEAKLARMTLVPLVINFCLILVSIIMLWLSAMGLVGYVLIRLSNPIWLTLIIILILNFSLLFGLLRYLTFNLTALSFSQTRRHLTKQGTSHDGLEKKTN
jgi:hypothetical protein